MFYIHQNTCISPQQTFNDISLDEPSEITDNKLMAREPKTYEGIPLGMLRRMGKAVRIGVGAALPLANGDVKPNGIVIGTANGGMEDCIKFLNQIIDYEEGTLTPTNFVQSTSNAIAGQIGMLSANQHYNITHVHRGLAFENAVLDTAMLLHEYPKATYLLGGLDEISAYNYNIDSLAGCYKEEKVNTETLYKTTTPGSVAGEGAAMFLVNNNSKNAAAYVRALCMVNNTDENILQERLALFLKEHLKNDGLVDLFLSGESGDCRQQKYITAIETVLNKEITIARFKHLTGDHPTASAISLWLATHLLQTQHLPTHMTKKAGNNVGISKILIYNNFKDQQHSFMIVEKV
jgi:hypothetical protein